MLLNCGAGEDSWESLGLQGDPTSPSWRKSVLNINWKDWCWSWNSNTVATWCEELTHWKRPWCWERLRAGGKGTAEVEMVGWHLQFDGHEFEQTPGVSDGQGKLTYCTMTSTLSYRVRQDWVTELNWRLTCYLSSLFCISLKELSSYLLVLPWD